MKTFTIKNKTLFELTSDSDGSKKIKTFKSNLDAQNYWAKNYPNSYLV